MACHNGDAKALSLFYIPKPFGYTRITQERFILGIEREKLHTIYNNMRHRFIHQRDKVYHAD